MLIFKIKSNSFNEKIGEIFQKLSSNYSLFFLGEALYVCPNKYNQKIDFKKALKPQKDFLISELTEEKLEFEEDVVKEWCKDRLVRLDLQRLEVDKQKQIRDILDYLDELDKTLEQTEKEGDEA